MKAVYLVKPKQLELREIDIPAPLPGEVLIKIKAVGICGSDVHFYEHGRIGNFVVEKPIILGHEAAGEVVEVGEGVENLMPGDRVAIEPQVPCRKCKYCKTGRYNICPDVEFWATPPTDGAFREFVTHPADFCFKLPDNVSYEEGAMMEPLSVGLWAVERSGVKPEHKVAILGSGTIGIMVLQCLKAVGVTDITVFDIFPSKLEIARNLGAKEVVLVKAKEDYKNFYNSFDVVFETAGSDVTVSEIPHILSIGGRGILVGLPPSDSVPLNVTELIAKEATIETVFRYANMYPRAVELVSEGKIMLKSLISRYFDLEHVPEAFEYVISKRAEIVKVMIVNNK
ncbi:Alcohol dehydrogenase GroES domain protein [Thermotoga petrophila RKU-10]|uniref:Alcohol dehydrogenase GroES domain protein n=1 Tax=Thermotoga petrophila (strain ATCC BAA-489 / DSM 13996 / JCM 10882 / RKU-10) TaxID=590168 RepID=D2C7U0_THEP2|nr:NAD(P)-dependent alcohol dehydrogenase [Thermotoga petrophila]ADA67026.1 Alcohol dehydrogenase GroES domain protein [Thermotoga petrophila RKU-10]